MNKQHKDLLRVACAIHQRLAANRLPAVPSPNLPEAAWWHCQRASRLHEKAQERGWTAAALRQQQYLAFQLAHIRSELAEIADGLKPARPAAIVQSILDVYRDLCGLQGEFPTVEWNLRGKTLSVHTEPITLREIYLGPFEIRLDWNALPAPHGYHVIALDAQPASPNDSVTHPHVQDEQLCEGEGRLAIRQALAQGRLADFFLIVKNLLSTYNAASPYVALSTWYGTRCDDCGASIADEERSSCGRCGNELCSDCRNCCPQCDDDFCCRCLQTCSGCEESTCANCLTACRLCHRLCCGDCLEDGVCESHQHPEEKSDVEQEPGTVTAPPTHSPAELAV